MINVNNVMLTAIFVLAFSSCVSSEKNNKINNDLGDKLVEMKFNETTGAIAYNDKSHYFNGEINYATRVDGIEGKALNFSNTAAQVIIKNPYFQHLTTENFEYPNSAMTVMAWVRVSAYDSELLDPIVWNWVNSFRLVLDDGHANFSLGDNGDWRIVVTDPNRLAINQWRHIAVTYDGSEAILYLDGAAVSTSQFIHKIPVEANEMYIGATRDGKSFTGDIDEIHLWRKKLTAQEIADYVSQFQSVVTQ